jgi:UDP-glucuronate decarboxylase
VRIFNTYGPGLRPRDGRVVSNFVAQAIRNEPLTIYGSGEQSRSFCFYSDLIEGLVRFMDSGHPGPINLGNPNEVTIRELASQIIEITNSSSEIIYAPNRSDDPTTRNPDIDLARSVLGWEPKVTLSEGLTNTVQWQQSLDSLSTPVIP